MIATINFVNIGTAYNYNFLLVMKTLKVYSWYFSDRQHGTVNSNYHAVHHIPRT